jgi:hypothetical protein
MKMQTERAYTSAHKIPIPRDLAPLVDLRALPVKRRRVGNVLRDFSFVVGGWVMLIGVIEYPLAHLIGLFVCSLALLLPTEKYSNWLS